MNTGDILDELNARSLLDADRSWTIESATGGLNSRVFRVQADGEPPAFTVRVRDTGGFANEVEALTEVAACPGVPDIVFANDRMLVHRFLPGQPRPLGELPLPQLGRLASVLACLHRHTSSGFTPWPDREPRRGSFGDLFRFRVGSLQNYTSYARGLAGALDPRLPDVFARLSSPAILHDPSWDDERFARLHGDLSFGNILWSESEVALIDWEFSRAGDPAEDLGYLLSEQPVGATVADSLRQQYVRAGGDERVWTRVPAYVLFTAADSALWWADYPATPSLNARAEIKRRLTTALHWIPDSDGHA